MARTWRPDKQDRAQYDARIKAWPQVTWRMLELLDGEDPRLKGRTEDLMSCDGTMVSDWLSPMLREGRLRILIAGDFDPRQALVSLAATFGALPQRAPWDAPSPYPPVPETPAGKYVSGPDPDSKLGTAASMLALGAPRSVDEGIEAFLLRNLADRQIRSLVRSVRGKSYSVSATIRKRSDEAGTWLLFTAPCDIKECDSVAGDIREVVAGLGQGKEWHDFQGACRLTGRYYRKRLRNPEQVLDLLAAPATYPGPRDLEMYRLTTLEPAVRALAARVMVPELAVELQTLPPE
jgi:predicted Zn-dependent peptidase